MNTENAADSAKHPLYQPYTEPEDGQFGEVAYEQTYKQGNKRYVCLVFRSENGAMTAVFRKYFRKADKDGKRVTYKNSEILVTAASVKEFKVAKFPDHPETYKFLKSDFFRNL